MNRRILHLAVCIAGVFCVLALRLVHLQWQAADRFSSQIITEGRLAEQIRRAIARGSLYAENGWLFLAEENVSRSLEAAVRNLAQSGVLVADGNQVVFHEERLLRTNPRVTIRFGPQQPPTILDRNNTVLVDYRWRGRWEAAFSIADATDLWQTLATAAARGFLELRDLARERGRPYALAFSQPDRFCVNTTLDLELQEQACALVRHQRSCIVVLDCRTGDVLALAENNPGDTGDRPLYLRAFAPGSAFKLIVALAALETGTITANESFICRGGIRPDPKLAYALQDYTETRGQHTGGHNPAGERNFTVLDALALSCNVTFAQIGIRLGWDLLQSYADQCSWTAPVLWNAPLLDELLPIEPAVLRRGPLRRNQSALATLAQTSIGQYECRAAPLHMALLAATIANDGRRPAPGLVTRWIDTQTGEYALTPQVEPADFCSPESAALIREGMRQAVVVGTARLAQRCRYRIAGKTGTAETGNGPPHAWFVGFAPADDPQIAFCVFVPHGGSGGRVPVQLLVELLNRVDILHAGAE